MRQLNGVYTQRFNRAHGRIGHVFQGRYKAILVQKESYLLELARYIVLNPVRAQMLRSARDWPWSNYRATAGMIHPPPWLETDWILGAFGAHRGDAQRAYRKFVSEGKGQPSPWAELRNQIYLGSEQFVERMVRRLEENRPLDEVPRSQRRPVAKSLEWYFAQSAGRDEAIYAAWRSGVYSMREIGEHTSLHYSRISRIVAKLEKARRKT